MPVVIRELNITVSVGQAKTGAGGDARPSAGSGGRSGKTGDAATVKRAVEEVMRLQAERKER